MPQSSVVIVGAGASGLSAAGALGRRGIKAVILEEDKKLGGTWARRYDRLHLHTVRGFSGLALSHSSPLSQVPLARGIHHVPRRVREAFQSGRGERLSRAQNPYGICDAAIVGGRALRRSL